VIEMIPGSSGSGVEGWGMSDRSGKASITGSMVCKYVRTDMAIALCSIVQCNHESTVVSPLEWSTKEMGSRLAGLSLG
jgi:hypothetical protein